GEIEVTSLEPDKISGHVRDLRVNSVEFAGLSPGTQFSLACRPQASESTREKADEAGVLRLNLPAVCDFTLSRIAN
ncbi:MAG: hypothetical protein JWO89_681, partial [Verrucomicrobiaceae bacterium]|nr:hypothetical protein [Verrucomicrobiaceae bacterium]